MGPLTMIDSVPVRYQEFSPEFNDWITNLIDTINFDLETLQSAMARVEARLTAGGL